MTVDRRLYSRLKVREVSCPECNAAVGDHCTSSRGNRRTSNHQSRVEAYAELRVTA